MNSYEVRRATLDDLPQLRQLWFDQNLPHDSLEKRFTEFQIAIDDTGAVIGALGLQIASNQGQLHSSVYRQLDDEKELLPVLWQRARNLAKNHGLSRLWLLEGTTFWREQGFKETSPAELKKFPEAFGGKDSPWLCLALREENLNVISLEQEMEIFAQAQKESTARLLEQAKLLRVFAYILLGVFILALIGLGIYVMRHKAAIRR